MMARLTESISAINSAVRTLLALVVFTAAGVGGWFGYQQFTAGAREAQQAAAALAAAQDRLQQANLQLQKQEAVIKEKEAEISTLNEQVKRLDTALRLLKVDHRVARLKVLDQAKDATSGELVSLIQFQELNDQGEPADEPKQFRLRGDLVYVDSWIVKFDDKYVEQSDLDRSTSLVLFRRIFGESQEPKDGYELDQVGARPKIYGRGDQMSDFEKRIWGDFWTVANDDAQQKELGIRAAHGDAPSIKVQKGRSYRVELRASDGLSIKPEPESAPPSKPAA